MPHGATHSLQGTSRSCQRACLLASSEVAMETEAGGDTAGLALHRSSFPALLYSWSWSKLVLGAPEMGKTWCRDRTLGTNCGCSVGANELGHCVWVCLCIYVCDVCMCVVGLVYVYIKPSEIMNKAEFCLSNHFSSK